MAVSPPLGAAFGLMFHHFHGGIHSVTQGSISAEELKRLLSGVGRSRIIPPQVWLDRTLAGKLGPDDVCLTFDDTLRCQFDVARPVLSSLGLTAFWFVNSGPIVGELNWLEVYRHFRTVAFSSVTDFYHAFRREIDRSDFAELIETGLREFDPSEYLKDFSFYSEGDRKFRYLRDRVLGEAAYGEVMSQLMRRLGYVPSDHAATLWMGAKEIRQLHDEGHVIGLHSHSHPTVLAALPELEQEQQYRQNHRVLTELLGESPVTMSHPCNSYSQLTCDILEDLGIVLGFRSNHAQLAFSTLEQPRIDHAVLMRALVEGLLDEGRSMK